MAASANNSRSLGVSNYLSGVLLASLINGPFLTSELLAAESQHLQLGIHQVGFWHAPDDSQLIIKNHQQQQYRATLKSPCPGLSKAKSIAFISNGNNALDQFSKVILPNGKRCPFKSFSIQATPAEKSN